MDPSLDHLLQQLDQESHDALQKPRQPVYHTSTYSSDQPNEFLSPAKLPVPQTDDDCYPYDVSFNAFEKDVIQQSYLDRRHQAERGRARLSLASTSGSAKDEPGPSHLRHGVFEIDSETPNKLYQTLGNYARARSARKPREASPSPSLEGASSSPMVMASRRRSENQSRLNVVESLGHSNPTHIDQRSSHQTLKAASPRRVPQQTMPSHDPPIAQNIQLVPRSELPERVRGVFSFTFFNAVQSRCFPAVYGANDNFVLSAPTGSGKTAVFELAICRTLVQFPNEQYKIVYQAPIKALCSERQRDWQQKFGILGFQCAEITGDSDQSMLASIKNATIIITTPEKWDSITRRWKDHEKLIRLIRLFLIDEIHILKEDRGATLEVVVSRMKSLGTNVRFMALSATVPNIKDIADWLGRDPRIQDLPALYETFSDEFRPVRLQKHVCGYQHNGNDFIFDSFLNNRLGEVIQRFSHGKPIMIFCSTRKSTTTTAKWLTDWSSQKTYQNKHWAVPTTPLHFKDSELQVCAASGVAFHHAGVDQADRAAVEKGYLAGDISVICCTSTLAAGINLPCHFVIIKNTVAYAGSVSKELSDLDIVQMLGRAGRPQFDASAVAVIMTRYDKVQHYEKMLSGKEPLESRLHLNLIDHLNSEIVLGTIKDRSSAERWISETFLAVRLHRNPQHYRLQTDSRVGSTEEQLNTICKQSIDELIANNLIVQQSRLLATESGDAMSRYYVRFDTMKLLVALQEKAKISEILSVLAQASEFDELRMRPTEKALYKTINQSPLMRFPIKVDLALTAHKISIIIQSVLGGIEFPNDPKLHRVQHQYQIDKQIIFKSISRLVRCIIDIKLDVQDAVSVRNALMLHRSIAASAWDDWPKQMMQLERIGIVAIRKLINANIRSIEDLENTEPHVIETALGRKPPFGLEILQLAKKFPKLRISLKKTGHQVLEGNKGVRVTVVADIGMLNDVIPTNFAKHPIYVCFLAETSEGRLIHFARIRASQLTNGQIFSFPAIMTSPFQSISCFVMCDGVAGTLRQANLQHGLPPAIFPRAQEQYESCRGLETANTSAKRQSIEKTSSKSLVHEFDDDGLDDLDLVEAASVEMGRESSRSFLNQPSQQTNGVSEFTTAANSNTNHYEQREIKPVQLPNGKWQCNHSCKNKLTCKHLCCREGLDKPRKTKEKSLTQDQTASKRSKKATNPQGRVIFESRKRKHSPEGPWYHIEQLDLTKTVPSLGFDGFARTIPSAAYDNGPAYQKRVGVEVLGSDKKFKSSRLLQNRDDPIVEEMRHFKPHCGNESNYSDEWVDGLPDLIDIKEQNGDDFVHTSVTNDVMDHSYGDLTASAMESLLVDIEDGSSDRSVTSIAEAEGEFETLSRNTEQVTSPSSVIVDGVVSSNTFQHHRMTDIPSKDVPTSLRSHRTKLFVTGSSSSSPTFERANDASKNPMEAGLPPQPKLSTSRMPTLAAEVLERHDSKSLENNATYKPTPDFVIDSGFTDEQQLDLSANKNEGKNNDDDDEDDDDLEAWIRQEFAEVVELV